ncbi:MAG: sigma-70 family RNA polymerase sigma factor [bacterium]|nr:sigma-70 family RNA polymerase sigma factor [bacterium]
MSKFIKGSASEQVSDLALLEIIRSNPAQPAGDRAVSQLFARYQRKIYLWCFRYVGDHEHALEMTQEVLMRAYRKLDLFRERSSFGTWLFVVTRNICLSEMKRNRLPQADVDLQELHDPRANPEEDLLSKLGEERLLRIIRDYLKPVEQQAIWLRCVEMMPVDEITRILGITDSSGARSMLQNTRRKLRAAVDRFERFERRGQ